MHIARIILGMVYFLAYVFYLPNAHDVFFYFSPDRINLMKEPAMFYSLYSLLLISALSLTLGYQIRVAGALVIAGHFLFHSLNPRAFWGWAYLINIFTVYVVLHSGSNRLSLSSLFSNSKEIRQGGSGLPVLLFKIHIALFYFYTGFVRLSDPAWLSGDATAIAMLFYGRFEASSFVVEYDGFLRLASYLALVFEIGAIVFLFLKRTRVFWALGLITMHLILEAITQVGWWGFVMTAGLIQFFPAAWFRRR